jgi:hypothetical protein
MRECVLQDRSGQLTGVSSHVTYVALAPACVSHHADAARSASVLGTTMMTACHAWVAFCGLGVVKNDGWVVRHSQDDRLAALELTAGGDFRELVEGSFR